MDYSSCVCVFLVSYIHNILGSGQFPEETLQQNLFENYIRTARPFTNDSFTTCVTFHLTLVKVIHLNAFSGVMEGEYRLWTHWQDDRLSWNPDTLGGLDYVNVAATAIWTPNIVLGNSAENDHSPEFGQMAVVTSSGNVSLFRTSRLKSACDLDLTYFPKDRQECQLIFASRTYNVQSLTLSARYDQTTNMSNSNNTTPWVLLDVTPERETTQQECGHEYDQVTYTVKVKRNCVYCRHLFVTPAAVLGLLVPFQFLMPINCRERSCFGGLLLIACVLMSSLLRDILPTSAHPSPKLGVYYCLTTVYVAVSLLFTLSTMHYCDTWRRRGTVPKVMKKIFIDGIGSLLCADSPKIPLGVSSDAPITEVTDADSKNAGLEYQLEGVLSILHSMQVETKRQRAEQMCLDEWRLISLVIDRFLFVVFMVMYFITTLEFLG